jgi:glucose-1-phosphate cytidylyltransferase
MKVVILAGGYGTRLSEETDIKPKPMVEIGGRPILWHIMKLYSHYGYNDFVICLGYKGYYIKEFFYNYYLHQSDLTINVATNDIEIHNNTSEPWKVTLVDTGLETMTGGRLKRIQPYVKDEQFMVTYGDGVADIDIKKLVQFHNNHKKLCTMSSTQPTGRFGALDIDGNGRITRFTEKPKGDGSWVNIGFFVFEPNFFKYLNDSPNLVFEKEPLETLAKDNELFTYQHKGFWKCMDNIRDKRELEEMWNNDPKWKVWK